ncbi:MAG: hypothetical protein JMJ93_09730 [Synergistaceae bacterium]|nr:hypothetical protein [Synergistaceae bacterium]
MVPSFALPGALVATFFLVVTAVRILLCPFEEERRCLLLFFGPAVSLVGLLLVLVHDVVVAVDFAIVSLALSLSFFLLLCRGEGERPL